MTHPQKHIEELEKSAVESELVSLLTPNMETRRVKEQQAVALRTRIDRLNKRLRRLTKDHPEK